MQLTAGFEEKITWKKNKPKSYNDVHWDLGDIAYPFGIKCMNFSVTVTVFYRRNHLNITDHTGRSSTWIAFLFLSNYSEHCRLPRPQLRLQYIVSLSLVYISRHKSLFRLHIPHHGVTTPPVKYLQVVNLPVNSAGGFSLKLFADFMGRNLAKFIVETLAKTAVSRKQDF